MTFTKPSELHWTVVANKSFSAFCEKAREKAATEKKGGTPLHCLQRWGRYSNPQYQQDRQAPRGS